MKPFNLPLVFRLLLISYLLGLLSACLRPDEAVLPYEPNDEVSKKQVSMGGTYENQVYFDLGSGEAISVPRNSWDLAFSCETEGFYIRLNSANYMEAAWIDTGNFEDITSVVQLTGLDFQFDAPSGAPDSTALGKWWLDPDQTNRLLILNRGRGADLSELGYVKAKISLTLDGRYEIRYAQLDGTNAQQFTISKETAYNAVFLSLESHQIVQVEPPKTEWDLLFSYYSYRYPDGMAYFLTGTLTNSYQVQAGEAASTMRFEAFSLTDTAKVMLRSELDEIGFDWKTYYFDPPGFVVDSERFFVIRDTEGYYYKLRFIDFYDELGVKGHPLFEYARL